MTSTIDKDFVWYRNIAENVDGIQKIRSRKRRGIKAGSVSLYEYCMEDTGDTELNKKRRKILEDYCIDNKFSPKAIPWGAGETVHFKCSVCGYEWTTPLMARTSKCRGCVNCAGQVANEKNNLGQWCEEHGEYGKRLADEYSPENEQDIWHIAAHSNKKVKWNRKAGGYLVLPITKYTVLIFHISSVVAEKINIELA